MLVTVDYRRALVRALVLPALASALIVGVAGLTLVVGLVLALM